MKRVHDVPVNSAKLEFSVEYCYFEHKIATTADVIPETLRFKVQCVTIRFGRCINPIVSRAEPDCHKLLLTKLCSGWCYTPSPTPITVRLPSINYVGGKSAVTSLVQISSIGAARQVGKIYPLIFRLFLLLVYFLKPNML